MSNAPKEYDGIRLLEDVPMENLREGAVGTILVELEAGLVFECEFFDKMTLQPISKSMTVTLKKGQFEVVFKAEQNL